MGYKKAIVWIGCLGMLAIMIACVSLLFSSANHNKKGEKQYKIGALYMTMNNPFFEVINEEMKAYVENQGDVIVTRDSALSCDMQIRQMEELIEEHVDILVVNSVDWKAIKPGLLKAQQAGVPVIALDTSVYNDDLVAGTVVSDNYGAGASCAKNLMKKKKTGKILFLTQKGNKSAVDRIQGFKETLEAAGWKYETVDEVECYGQLEIAQPLVEKILKKRKDIDVVMALNDPSALGAMAALDASGLLENVLVYSVDGSPEAKTMIYEKRMTATVSQSPTKLGLRGAQMIYDVLDKKSYEKEVILPTKMITEKNISRFSLTGWQ